MGNGERNQTYRGGLVRRLITACNEFEWLAWRARNLSRERGAICSPTSSTNHSKLPSTVTTRTPSPPPFRVPPSLSLSLPHQPLGSLPPAPAGNPTPRSALSNLRPPFPYAYRFYARNRFNPARRSVQLEKRAKKGVSKTCPFSLSNDRARTDPCSLKTVLFLSRK